MAYKQIKKARNIKLIVTRNNKLYFTKMNKKILITVIILFLKIVLFGQTKNIVINESMLNQLTFGMTIKSAERLLGNEFVKKIKKGRVCDYNRGYSNVTTRLIYKKMRVTLQFEKRYQKFGFLKTQKLLFISINDSSLVTVNNIGIQSDTSQIIKEFGKDYSFDQSNADTYLMTYGGVGIWFFIDTSHKIKEIVIESKIITPRIEDN